MYVTAELEILNGIRKASEFTLVLIIEHFKLEIK